MTGAASGIGRAIALRLAREGCDLWLLDVNLEGLQQTAAGARQLGVEVVARKCDLSRPEEISRGNQAMLAKWGGLDILVNNAGVVYYGPTENMTAQQWSRLMAINLLAPIQFVQELLPVLKERPESHIINIASIYGLVPFSRTAAYSVSKFGLVGLSESLRAEYGRQGVGVSLICPGFVRTNLFGSGSSGHADRQIPEPPRLLTTSPEHVADKVLRAIHRDQRMVLVTPLAHFLHYLHRFAPGLLDFLHRLGRRRRMAKNAARRALENRPAVEVPIIPFRKAA